MYALDDTTPLSGSVGGKVATTRNQAPDSGMTWIPPNGFSSTAIYGINLDSTTSSPSPSGGQKSGQLSCEGRQDGSCNTNNIYLYYLTQNAGQPAPPTTPSYAAGRCKNIISGYLDWYLPSICEMGPAARNEDTGCGPSDAPLLQNMDSNLKGLISNVYSWSSTQYSDGTRAWYQNFKPSGSGDQNFTTKGNSSNATQVFCSRALTY